MTSFLSFHAITSARGDGLHPRLRALFERVVADPHSELTPRPDGMIQSGPDSASVRGERINHANPDAGPLAREYARRSNPESLRGLGLLRRYRA
jgi:hypothetical protein